MKSEAIKLSDDQVRVQIAKCPACKKIVLMAIAHLMERKDEMDFVKLMRKECKISRISLEEARNLERCFLDCDRPLVVPRQLLIEKTINT